MHLEQLAHVLNVPIDELRMLNPQYRRDVIPGNGKSYSICLPSAYAELYIDKEQEILAYKADELIHNRRAEIDLAQQSVHAYGNGVIYYKVKSGNTLGGIAQKYRVSVSQLKKWNNIKGTTIRVGQTLKIYR
jgi:membrane-bound lytic murein transglycosylase D